MPEPEAVIVAEGEWFYRGTATKQVSMVRLIGTSKYRLVEKDGDLEEGDGPELRADGHARCISHHEGRERTAPPSWAGSGGHLTADELGTTPSKLSFAANWLMAPGSDAS